MQSRWQISPATGPYWKPSKCSKSCISFWSLLSRNSWKFKLMNNPNVMLYIEEKLTNSKRFEIIISTRNTCMLLKQCKTARIFFQQNSNLFLGTYIQERISRNLITSSLTTCFLVLSYPLYVLRFQWPLFKYDIHV